MKLQIHKLLLILFLLFVLVFRVAAVPAYPYPIQYKQPDGSKITIQLKGDEKVRWAETTDGYTLVSNGANGWEYAVQDKSGNLKSSGILAHEPDKRVTAEQKLIKGLQKKLVFSQIQINTLKSVWEAKFGSAKLVDTGEFFNSPTEISANKDSRKKVFTPRGIKKLLMILIEYQDNSFTFTRQNFVDLMNTQNFSLLGAHGSVRDYYLEQSYGQFDIRTDVAPSVYKADYNMAYYGANDANGDDINAGALMLEACEKADADGVDFSQYDNDNDGSVDGVYIIYAGYGEASSGIDNTIWPHAGGIAGKTFDGKKVSKYSCSNELNADGTLTTIGVICHEFGHVCGAPDYYDTDYATGGSFSGNGDWDLMDVGVYNGTPSGSQPPHFNPFEKIRAGWVTPVQLTGSTTLTIPDITTNPVVYSYNTTTDNEYFLIENRQQSGFNSACPGHGLMIYHYSKSYWDLSANKTAPQGFYPVCASATVNPTTVSDKSSYGTINSTGCPFPGSSGKTEFSDVSTPSSKSWAGNNTGYPLTNIVESGGSISLCFNGCPAINSIQSFKATPAGANQINLSWLGSTQVTIARNITNSFGTPVAGGTLSGDGEIVFSGTASSFNDTGLSASTTYYYQIWATDGSSFSVAAAANGTTSCSSVSQALFTEGFEEGVLPGCWSVEYVKEPKDWSFQTGGYTGSIYPTSARTGTKNACLFSGSWTSSTTKLITPPLDLSAATAPVLKFWHTQTDWGTANQDILRIYYRTSLTSEWVKLAEYTNSITIWKLESVELPNSSATYYIAFEGTTNYGRGVCIDDVEIWQASGTNQWTGSVSTDWFTPSNWSAGLVPTSTNDVEIPSGTPNSPAISASGATCQNITIQNGAELSMDGSVAQTLSVYGNWTNHGLFNRGIGIVSFDNQTENQTIAGTARSDFYMLRMNKKYLSNILEATSVITLNAPAQNWNSPMEFVGGTFKLSSASTITPFQSGTTLHSNDGLWNNGGDINLSGKSVYVQGLFRSSAGNSLFAYLNSYSNVCQFIIEGGVVTVTGFFGPYNNGAYTASYTQSGGNFIVNSSYATVPFSIGTTGSSFTMSGGSIIVQKASAAACDYQNLAETYNITGGTLQIGNASTSGSPNIRINSAVPLYNLVVNGTGTPSATLLSNLTVQNQIEVQSGAKLLVSSGKQLTAASVTNSAGVAGFVLGSDANGTATFVNSGSAGSSVQATVQQFLKAGHWYTGTPVSGATSAVFAPGATNKLAFYTETSNPPAYVQITDNITPLVSGTGYVTLAGSDNTYSFSGVLHDGDITLHPSRTGNTAAKRGYNLISNPYPSYIDWNAAVKTNLASTIWYRTRTSDGQMVFDTYNGLTGTGVGVNGVVNQYIPPMQGFWVRVDADGHTGTLILSNAIRSHRDQSLLSNRLRTPSEAAVQMQEIRLKVTNGTNSDEAILLATPLAQEGMDYYDAPKMKNENSNIPEIFTLNGGEELTINCVGEFKDSQEFVLGFRPGKAGQFQISALTNELSLPLILVDNYTHVQYPLTTENNTYSFTSDANETKSRFAIKFRSSSETTEVDDYELNKPKVYVNSMNAIVVETDQNLPVGTYVSVYNALGQKLAHQFVTSHRSEIRGTFSAGVYFVHLVCSENNRIVNKIVVNQ
jgi:M6 family metalloprotease-like protein